MTIPMDEIESILSKVAKGVPKVEAEKGPDEKDIREEISLEFERKAAAVANEWMLIDLRKKYGRNIIRFLWVYFLFSVVVIGADAFHAYGFALPESVLAAIVGGTAVSVLGVVGTVAAGLFRPPTV